MAQYIPCQHCGRFVNRIVTQCPYCGDEPRGDRPADVEAAEAPVTAPLPRYIPLGSVALFLQLLLGLFILANAVALLSGIPYRSDLLAVAAGLEPGSAVNLAEGRYNTAFVLVTVAYVATAVAFLVWFWRAYTNLGFFGRSRSRSPGWAVGSWFIPFAGMIIPYGIGAEIWTQSRPEPGPVRERRDPNMEPIISWWALFLMMSLINVVESFILEEGYDAADLAAYVGVDMVGSIVAIAAAIAAIRFVRAATARQEKLWALSRSGIGD